MHWPEAIILIVVGTAGATNLPNQVAREVYQRQGVIIDINVETNPFSQMAQASGRGFFIQQPSASALPEVFAALNGGSCYLSLTCYGVQ